MKTSAPSFGRFGIVGGGQLARMLCLEAKRMGGQVSVWDPDENCPASTVCDVFVCTPYESQEGLERFAASSSVVTLDTEVLDVSIIKEIEKHVPVRPSSGNLKIVQNRISQRALLRSLNIAQPPFAVISTLEELNNKSAEMTYNCILKTSRNGYDGKGQIRIQKEEDVKEGARLLKTQPCVLEKFIPFSRELSLIIARSLNGDLVPYPLAENEHRNGILHTSIAPAQTEHYLQEEALQIAEDLLTRLDYCGVMAIEFFESDGHLLLNEFALRTHNSGHLSFGGAITSQFEQHLRATSGAPLGDPTIFQPVAMLNLLGDLWSKQRNPTDTILKEPHLKLHLYAKADARPGRKMGHVLAFGKTTEEALQKVEQLFNQLQS